MCETYSDKYSLVHDAYYVLSNFDLNQDKGITSYATEIKDVDIIKTSGVFSLNFMKSNSFHDNSVFFFFLLYFMWPRWSFKKKKIDYDEDKEKQKLKRKTTENGFYVQIENSKILCWFYANICDEKGASYEWLFTFQHFHIECWYTHTHTTSLFIFLSL